MLTAIGRQAGRWLERANPWSNVYGLARSLLATSTALTLAFSDSTSVFPVVTGSPKSLVCSGLSRAGLFCLGGGTKLELIRWVAVALLALIASGWRPRLTGILHWWVSYSFASSATLVDGGDQLASILTLLMIPITLTDHRRWHWQSSTRAPHEREASALVAGAAHLLLRTQVAAVYFDAAYGKMLVPEWADGTALYYWFQDGSYGPPPWLRPLIAPLTYSPTAVTYSTWGVIALEFALAAGLLMDRRYWRPLLLMGIALHAGIALVHGLVSFSIVMTAALVLYLRPWEDQFTSTRVPLDFARRAYEAARRRSHSSAHDEVRGSAPA